MLGKGAFLILHVDISYRRQQKHPNSIVRFSSRKISRGSKIRLLHFAGVEKTTRAILTLKLVGGEKEEIRQNVFHLMLPLAVNIYLR